VLFPIMIFKCSRRRTSKTHARKYSAETRHIKGTDFWHCWDSEARHGAYLPQGDINKTFVWLISNQRMDLTWLVQMHWELRI